LKPQKLFSYCVNQIKLDCYKIVSSNHNMLEIVISDPFKLWLEFLTGRYKILANKFQLTKARLQYSCEINQCIIIQCQRVEFTL